MADVIINDKLKITNFGGAYTNGGVAKLFAPTIPAVGEAYYWDDTGGTREGWTIEIPNGMAVTKVVIYGSQSYPMRSVAIEQNGATLSPVGPASTSAPYTYEGNIVGTFQIARYLTYDQAMTRILIYGSVSKAILKSNDKFYAVTDANYNTTTKMYNPLPVTADMITPAYVDSNGISVSSLVTPVTLGGETFKPIDKFASFRVISKSANATVVSGVRRTKSLIRSKSAYSFKGMSNIDGITSVNTITNTGVIRMAVLVEGETEWKTTKDNGTTWTPMGINIPAAEYSTLSASDKTAWNTAMNEILTNGIPVNNIINIKFASFAGKKVFLAFAFNIANSTDKAILASLNIQYDGTEFWRLMKDSESNIDIIDDVTVQVTPLITNDKIKVNINNGGTRGLS